MHNWEPQSTKSSLLSLVLAYQTTLRHERHCELLLLFGGGVAGAFWPQDAPKTAVDGGIV